MSSVFRSAALALAFAMAAATPISWAGAQQPSASARDTAQEERNRRIVLDFYEGVFVRHEVARSAEVLVDEYIQHNPDVPDGKVPFVDYFTGFFQQNPNAGARIARSAADGDLVYLHVHSTNGENDRGRAIVDIFRVKDGRIVEHWDVIQPVPETAANNNTMF